MRVPIKMSQQVDVKSSLDENVTLVGSDIHGVGLFAVGDIKQETAIQTTHFFSKPFGWMNLVPNCKYNHSKENKNCEVITSGNLKLLVSLRDIKAGEELLSDYTQNTDISDQPKEGWRA